MTPATSLALSCVAMICLISAVGARMLRHRLGEMKVRRIHPQSVATGATSTNTFQSAAAIQASDNFKNLFEVPTLFYPLCIGLIATGHATPAFAIAAWMFVVLRVAHSAIQCTTNKVKVRFAAFAASSFVLFGLWLAFGVVMLGVF